MHEQTHLHGMHREMERGGRGLPRYLEQLETRHKVSIQESESPLMNLSVLALQTKGSLYYISLTDFEQGKRPRFNFTI